MHLLKQLTATPMPSRAHMHAAHNTNTTARALRLIGHKILFVHPHTYFAVCVSYFGGVRDSNGFVLICLNVRLIYIVCVIPFGN